MAGDNPRRLLNRDGIMTNGTLISGVEANETLKA